jgi:3D (Asp-Asp-Asp) domain-containing protein
MGTKAWAAGVGAAALLAAAAPAAAADHRALLEKIDSDHFGLPAPQALGTPLRLWATWYHVLVVDAAARGFPLLDVGGKAISPPIAGRDWCLGALQGAIMIRARDGTKRTYTYEAEAGTAAVDCAGYLKHPARWAQTAGRSRFGVSKGPFGDGAAGFQIVPYRTVAVGAHLLPLGTVLYIPAARGVPITLPSGRKAVHDGYFFASDHGGGVRHDHIDVFVGEWPENPFPSFVTSTHEETFEAYVVGDLRVKPHLQRLHALE